MRYVQGLPTCVYSPSVSSSLSVSNSSSLMSSSSISGLSSVKTTSSSVPSKAFEIPQVMKDFLTISWGISAHAALIQRRTRFLLGAFFLPAGVNSNGPDIIHAKYFRRTLSLKGLLRHLSKGCTTGVRPPGITATSMFLYFPLFYLFRLTQICFLSLNIMFLITDQFL